LSRRFLVDTNLLIRVVRRRPGYAEYLAELAIWGSEVGCSVITTAEMYSGMRPWEEPRTVALLSQFKEYSVTPAIGKRAGLMRRDAAAQGETRSLPDSLIAATAFEHGLVVVTMNAKDFRYEGLAVVAPSLQ
jgi:predicted nucleic acid-binding protein